ncbi:MAG: LamG-like jellyroll fold domain-containing protein [Bacteroidia bacterium]
MKKKLLCIALSLGAFVNSFSQTLDFDGADDNVSIPNSSSLQITTAYTFEAWINIRNYQYGTFISKWDDDSNNRSWMINMGETGDNTKICVVQADPTWGGFNIQWNTGFSPDLNTWYHMAVTFDGTLPNNNLSLYINGALQAQTTFNYTLTANNIDLILGGYDGPGNGTNGGANSRFLAGAMDEVRLYNTARSAAEIADDANCAYSSTGLVASYNFNQGTANADNSAITTLTDNSGNSNNGTPNNFTMNGYGSNLITDVFSPNVQISEGMMVTYSASEVYSSNSVDAAFDGDTIVNGWGNNDNLPAWLEVDFGAGNGKVVTGYSFYCSSNMVGGWGSATYDPKAWTFQGFNGTKWDTLDTRVDPNPTQDQWNTFTFANTTAYQAYRIFISNSDDGGWVMITELKLLPAPSVNECSNKLFTAAPGNPIAHYQWKLNGSNIGTDNDSLTLASFFLHDTLSCVMSFNSSCFTSVTSNTIILNQGMPHTTTSVNGNMITADQTGATYQWVDCNNGKQAIAGETNQTYTATQNGSYAVVVTSGGCSDTSSCVTISSMSISSGIAKNVSVFPNPSTGVVLINIADANVQVNSVSVHNLYGAEVFHSNETARNFKIDLSDMPKGVYFVSISSQKEVITRRIIIE